MNLRRELRKKIKEVLIDADVLDVDNCGWLIDKLADAALEVSGIAKRTDETAAEYNAELFRGDWRVYPENLWKIAEALRDVWMFKLPAPPKKKSEKSEYAFYIQAMTAIKDACAEFGVSVLVKVHADWKAKFKDGIAPYTVAQPTSLINVCAGKARELREAGEVSQSERPETQKFIPEDSTKFVPRPR